MDSKQSHDQPELVNEATPVMPTTLPDQQQQQPYAPSDMNSQNPPLPPRAPTQSYTTTSELPNYDPQHYANQPTSQPIFYPPPPKRNTQRYSEDLDVSSPIHYTRDPKKLVAYLVPFPKPRLPNVPPESIPTRYLIYAPPPPPLTTPKEGEKEGRVHKVQRKWEAEIREAKTSDVKNMSWKGIKGKAVKGINW